jgi:hypothetical protein
MKLLLFITAFLLAATISKSQVVAELKTPTLSPGNALLKNSKKQMRTANILMVSGAVLAGTGAIIALQDFNIGFSLEHPAPESSGFAAGETLAVIGGLLALTSIPFYAAGITNKKKAKLMIKSEKLDIPGITLSNQPAISIAFHF